MKFLGSTHFGIGIYTLWMFLIASVDCAGTQPISQEPLLAPAPKEPVPFWSIFQEVCGSRAIERAAQCRQESAFNPKAESWVHAQGLMQAMPVSWKWYQDMKWVPKDKQPWDPYWSIVGGHAHQSFLEARTKEWTGALAAYNWGRLDRIRKAQIQAELLGFPARDWQKFLKIPEETRGYVTRIPNIQVPWVKARVLKEKP